MANSESAMVSLSFTGKRLLVAKTAGSGQSFRDLQRVTGKLGRQMAEVPELKDPVSLGDTNLRYLQLYLCVWDEKLNFGSP